jgi:hypothetical protein
MAARSSSNRLASREHRSALIAAAIDAPDPSDALAAARAWRDASHAVVCDVDERWEHGRILRATRYPTYYDLNFVLVEDAAPLEGEEVRAVGDRALAELAHRRVVFDHLDNAEPLRGGFEAAGWKAMRLLWLRHDGSTAAAPRGVEVAEVEIDDVRELRFAWHHEADAGGDDASFALFLDKAREVAEQRGARVFAALESGEAVGFVQLERIGAAAEITQAFVRSDRRGGGRGGALIAAAIAAAHDLEDLYICADRRRGPRQAALRANRLSPGLENDGVPAAAAALAVVVSGLTLAAYAELALLQHMTYVSSATGLFSTQQLTDLLRRSRESNQGAGISGMLLYKDGNFMQTVEGPGAAVEDLEARLARDHRHRGMLVLLRGERAQREFDGWSMGFAT